MTLGVRIIVSNLKGEVLLVRHTYVSGWHLPGGGVEKQETASDAACKELMEEAGIRVLGSLELKSVHANRKASKRDHVLLYHCKDWEIARPFVPNREIAEIGFFALQNVPELTTPSTRLRLEEIFAGRPPADFW